MKWLHNAWKWLTGAKATTLQLEDSTDIMLEDGTATLDLEK